MAATRSKKTTKLGAGPYTLAIDIGGTGLKALVLDGRGKPVNERVRLETPRPATPAAVMRVLRTLVAKQPKYDRVSVGFPGVVFDGVIHTAPNLDGNWSGFELEVAIEKIAKKPARVANDASIQGWGVIEGKGVELVLTLGTGVGSGLYVNGVLVPNLELGHHPFRKGKSYEDFLDNATLAKIGKKKWRKRVAMAVAQLEPIFNYRVLYLGGGNARELKASELPKNVKLVDNSAGLLGGIRLWMGHT